MRCFRFSAPRLEIRIIVFFVLASALLCPSAVTRAIAQVAATSATIQGTVCNPSGDPMPKATVRLQPKERTKAELLRSDEKGSFTFSGLRDGAYIVRAEMSGFADGVSDEIVVGPNEVKTINLKLGAAGGTAGTAATSSSSAAAPQFFDEPAFTVAGVADTTNLGGHGSDVVVRARDSLSRDTSSLRGTAATVSASDAEEYEKARRNIQKLLAHSDSAELHHSLADIDEKLRNPVEAVHEYQRAAEMNPSEGNLFDWGSELLLHHAPEPALEVFQKGNRLFSQSVRMLLGLGAAWYAHGSFDEAVRKICEASDLDPENPTPYLFLGRMQRAEVKPTRELVGKLDRFVKLHPEDAMANYYDAVGLWKLRQSPNDHETNARVENLLLKAVGLDSKLSEAFLQLGIIYSEQKELPKAIAAYERATQIDPTAEAAHYRLAQAYKQSGQAEKAKGEIKIYDQLVKEAADKNERERHEIQQFVYTLRDQPASVQAK
jgi:tetratricopeptide (TPR) repeat protein